MRVIAKKVTEVTSFPRGPYRKVKKKHRSLGENPSPLPPFAISCVNHAALRGFQYVTRFNILKLLNKTEKWRFEWPFVQSYKPEGSPTPVLGFQENTTHSSAREKAAPGGTKGRKCAPFCPWQLAWLQLTFLLLLEVDWKAVNSLTLRSKRNDHKERHQPLGGLREDTHE